MKDTNPVKAVQIMIEAHSEKRRNLSKAVQQYQLDVDGLRKNAKQSKRAEYERRLRCAKEILEQVEEDIHSLDSLEVVAEEYVEIDNQISELCEKRRELCPSSLLQCMLKTAIKDGKCFLM